MKSLTIFLALVFMPAAAMAQLPATGTTRTTQVTVQFVPSAELKPLVYELGFKGVPVFKVRLEGQEVWAILDNGAGRTIIDTGFARSAGLELTPAEDPFLTPGGEVERWTVPQVAIEVPGQMSMRAPVSAIDLSGLSQLLGRPLTLIIGKEYFDNLEVVVQPVKRQILFTPSGAVRLPETTPYLPLQGESSQIGLTIAGQPVSLSIDLGANGDITVTDEAWHRLGMDRLPATEGHVANADGRAGTRISTVVDGVVMGPSSIDDVEVSLAGTFAEHGDGIIGFRTLSRFIFALDVKARRLWLLAPIPPAASDSAPPAPAPAAAD